MPRRNAPGNPRGHPLIRGPMRRAATPIFATHIIPQIGKVLTEDNNANCFQRLPLPQVDDFLLGTAQVCILGRELLLLL